MTRQGLTAAPSLSSITKGDLMSTKHLRDRWGCSHLPRVFFCFDLALTAWGERGGSTTWLCRPAGREMGARSPPSAPQPRCPTLPASCGVWDNCGGGFPLLASKSTAVSPRRGGFQRREMSETEREGLALEGSLTTPPHPPYQQPPFLPLFIFPFPQH